MAVIIQYVVQHNGQEKLVTTDKKAADQFDKMLEAADNLNQYIAAKGIQLDAKVAEDLTIMLSKNKDSITKLLKGADAGSLLEEEKASVVEMAKKQA